MQFFQGAVRADQGAKRLGAVVALDLLEAIGHVFQSRLPVHTRPFAALLDHGRMQAVRAAERLVGKTVAVGNPAFVDRIVFQRHHAHDMVVFDLHHQISASGVMRADRLAT